MTTTNLDLTDDQIPWKFHLPFVVRNVMGRWRRTLGATVGVGLALGLVVAVMGLSYGSRYLITGEYLESGVDLYITTSGGKVSIILPGESHGNLRDAKLLLNQLRTLPDVRRVIATLQGSVSRELDRKAGEKIQSQLWPAEGVWGDPTQIPGMIKMKQGRWILQSNEVVIGNTLADAQNVQINDSITLNGRRFRVVGIGKLNGVGYAGAASVYLDYDALRNAMQIGDVVSMVFIDSNNPPETVRAATSFRSLEIETGEQVRQYILDLMNAEIGIYYGVSILALAIAALFVSNVLTTAVNERRAEFATLRAIGIPSRTIVLSVVIEAVVISLLAFVIGALGGVFLGEWINIIYTTSFGLDSIFIVDSNIFLQLFAIAVGLGIASSLLPARAALRVQPAEALREAA